MFRFVPLLLLLATTGTAAEPELPPDISAKDREKVVKLWQGEYVKERDKLAVKVDDAKTLIKFADTAAEGRRKLGMAQKAVDELKREPWRFGSTPFAVLVTKPTTGNVGWLAAPSFKATSVTADGVAVEGVAEVTIGGSAEKQVTRYFVASPLKVPKGQKNPPVMLPGLWYVAGTREVGGQTLPVIYRFMIEKDDFPK